MKFIIAPACFEVVEPDVEWKFVAREMPDEPMPIYCIRDGRSLLKWALEKAIIDQFTHDYLREQLDGGGLPFDHEDITPSVRMSLLESYLNDAWDKLDELETAIHGVDAAERDSGGGSASEETLEEQSAKPDFLFVDGKKTLLN